MGAYCSALTSDYILDYPIKAEGGFPEIIPILNPDNLAACPVYDLIPSSSSSSSRSSSSSSPGKGGGTRGLERVSRLVRSKGKSSNAPIIPCAANTFEFVCQVEAGIESITVCQNALIVRPAFDIVELFFEFAMIPLDGVTSVSCETEPCVIARSSTCGGLPEYGDNSTLIQTGCPNFFQSALNPTSSLSISGFTWWDFCGNGNIVANYNDFGVDFARWNLTDEQVFERTNELIAYTGDPGREVTDLNFGGAIKSSSGGSRKSKGKSKGKAIKSSSSGSKQSQGKGKDRGSQLYPEVPTTEAGATSTPPSSTADQGFLDQSNGGGSDCHSPVVSTILGAIDANGDGVVDGTEIAMYLDRTGLDLSGFAQNPNPGFSEDACP